MPLLFSNGKTISSNVSTKLLSSNPLPTDGKITSLAQTSLNSSALLGSAYLPDTILYGASIRWTSSKVCTVKFEIYKNSIDPQNVISSITDNYTASDVSDSSEKLTVLNFNKFLQNTDQFSLILAANFAKGDNNTIAKINSVELACSKIN